MIQQAPPAAAGGDRAKIEAMVTPVEPEPPPLDRAFFARDAATVARDLVGATMAVAGPDGIRRVRLVETEAYVGAHDRACHAARGRTARTAVMFGPPGHLYVYLVYGLHELVNVVTGPAGEPQAVLLRAAEPLCAPAAGDDVVDPLAGRGPGKLARHLALTRADNGADVCAGGGAGAGRRCWFARGAPPGRLGVSKRIGIGYAGDWADAPLRFFDPDSRAVSGSRRANAAPAQR